MNKKIQKITDHPVERADFYAILITMARNCFKILCCACITALYTGCSLSQHTVPTQEAAVEVTTSPAVCFGMTIKTIQDGYELKIDPESLPANLKDGYQTFRTHCTHCHSETRSIGFLQDCKFSYSQNYESNLKVTILKKTRRSGGGVSKDDAKKIFNFLITLYNMGEKS